MTKHETYIITKNEISPENISRAAEILRNGGTGILPTETVYGLCAHPLRPDAARKLYDLKRRDYGKPFQVLISDMSEVWRLAACVPPAAFELMRRHWPGPLTLVLRARDGGTIGLRMPDHPAALDLIRRCGGSLLATSANYSDLSDSTDFETAIRLFGGLADVAIDGGPASRGSASSVIDFSRAKPVVLRKGLVGLAY